MFRSGRGVPCCRKARSSTGCAGSMRLHAQRHAPAAGGVIADRQLLSSTRPLASARDDALDAPRPAAARRAPGRRSRRRTAPGSASPMAGASSRCHAATAPPSCPAAAAARRPARGCVGEVQRLAGRGQAVAAPSTRRCCRGSRRGSAAAAARRGPAPQSPSGRDPRAGPPLVTGLDILVAAECAVALHQTEPAQLASPRKTLAQRPRGFSNGRHSHSPSPRRRSAGRPSRAPRDESRPRAAGFRRTGTCW